MQPLDNWLIDLQSDPMFQILVRKLTNERPSLPPFNADKDNTEKWKVMTGRQQGFDLCMSLLKIKIGD
jgi:hypothetical protein